jgi:hypothetical protein
MVASTGLGTAVLALDVEAKRTKQVHLPSPAWITRIGEFFRRGVAPSRSLEHWRDETSQCSGVALAERGEASSRFADRGDGKGGRQISGRNWGEVYSCRAPAALASGSNLTLGTRSGGRLGVASRRSSSVIG